MRRTLSLSPVLLAACVAISVGCAGRGTDGGEGKSTDGPTKAGTTGASSDGKSGAEGDDKPVEIANPASKHCVEKGGKLEIKEGANGQSGVCVFSDGSRCEEWAFVRNECEVGKCFEDSGVCK